MSSPIDARELLEHLDFIQGLARALLEDGHEADDVSQEAIVAALGARPRIQSSLRSWLAGVLRNKALLHRRSEGRRAHRHLRACRAQRGDEGELFEDAVERAELRRRVVEAVVALSEPYRLTVILRYMEELPPSRISELTSTPVATVKTRLQRGLEQLRARLDDDYGDRERWSSPMLLLAQPGESTAPGETVGDSTGMRERVPRNVVGRGPLGLPLQIAAGVVFAISAIAIAVPFGVLDSFVGSDLVPRHRSVPESEPSLGSVRELPTSNSDSLAASPRAKRDSRELKGTTREPLSAPSPLLVRVFTIDGTPVEGARIEFEDDLGLLEDSERDSVAITDHLGEATLSHPSNETARRDTSSSDPGAGRRNLALSVGELSPSLVVSHPDFVVRRSPVEPTASVIEVTLHPGREFIVRTLDARDDAPIENAIVRVATVSPEALEGPGSPDRTPSRPSISRALSRSTDAVGEARFRVEEGAILLIEVESIDHARVQRAHPLGALDEDVTLRLEPGGELRVRRRVDEEPVELRLVGPIAVRAELAPFESGCEVTHLPPGEYWLVAIRGEGQPWGEHDPHSLPGDSTSLPAMDPARLREWRGRVTGRSFAIESNESTTIDLDGRGFEVVVRIDEATLDAPLATELVLLRESGELASVATPEPVFGSFRFSGVSPGRYRLRLVRDGVPGAMDSITIPDRDVEHHFALGVATLTISTDAILGREEARRTGHKRSSPILSSPILVGLIAGDGSRSTEPILRSIPPSGETRLSGLRTGSGRLWTGHGTTISAATVDLHPGDNVLSREAFDRELEVTIEVTEAGRRVPAIVALLPLELGMAADSPPFACNFDPLALPETSHSEARSPREAPTGAEALRVVCDWRLAPGRYRATYGTPERPPQEREIEVGDSATIRLELESTHRFEVEVTRGGVARAGETIVLSRVGRSWSVPVQSGPSGVVTLDVPPGRYRLAPHTGPAREFELEPGTARVSVEFHSLRSPK